MSEKICSTEGCENPVTTKKRSKCTKCLTAKHLAWRNANIEKARAAESEWRHKNAEKLRLKEKEPERRDRQNANRRARRAQNPEVRERQRQRTASYFSANRERLNRERCERAKKRTPEERWRSHLRQHYGITPEEYDAMVALQEGVCAICLKPPSEKERKLSVDHCHNSQRVRKLLCRFCNVLVGHLEGKPDLVRRAYEYIAQHSLSTE